MNSCDICKNDSLKKIALNGFSILKCSACGFGRLETLPDIESANKIYGSEYFDEKSEPDHLKDSKKKYLFVKNYLEGNNTILDFGCGTGNFLLAAKADGHYIYGHDISQHAAQIASKRLNANVTSGPVSEETFNEGQFDCITCFDVIEHLPDYRDKIRLFQRWLKPEGLLFITTPNINSWDAAVLGKRWYGFKKYPEHVVYFSPKSMMELLKSEGFDIQKIKVWGFVRSFKYIVEHLFQHGRMRKILMRTIDKLGLDLAELYLPMVDMLVVAKKH